MTHTMVAQIKRKPGMTPLQFRNHYETVHVPLLQSLFGIEFPLSHTRHYVTRLPLSETQQSGTNSNSDFPAVRYREGFKGSNVEYDAISILLFRDLEHFNRFKNLFFEPKIQRQVREDEVNFQDVEYKLACALEEAVTTLGE
jgi:hypothetical protein